MSLTTPRYRADSEGLRAAAAWLAEGGLVIYPTESFYGLGADPRISTAVEAIFAVKGRGRDLPLPLLAGDLRQVGQAVPHWDRQPAARALANAFWPGPLSLVVAGSGGLAPGVAARDGSVAIRYSSHPLAAALARELGFPLVATSANLSGEPPATEAEEAARSLRLPPGGEAKTGGELEAGPPRGPSALLLDGGSTPGGEPSTIVALVPQGARVLREGAISRRRVNMVLREIRS